MNFLTIKSVKNKSLKDYGYILFLTGLFFLPSSLLIGSIFLLPAAIVGTFTNKKSFLKDQWNYSLIIFGLVILISTFLQNFILNNAYSEIWDPRLSFVGLANWLPFIWLFWAFQPFLDSNIKRNYFGLIVIAGSFPVLISGFGQYFLSWHGPLESMYGLIVWYQRPIEIPGGLSGLFSNQNYAGSWLNFVWPFCLTFFIRERDNNFKRLVIFGFLFSVGFAGFLTYSRNAWLGFLTSITILSGRKGLKIILISLTILIFLYFLLFLPSFFEEAQKQFVNLIPEKIILEFVKEGYTGLDVTRSEILLSGIKLIKVSPLFGIGAGSFPGIFLFETGFWKGHSHNLLIELAVSYGLPATVIFFATISSIIFLSGKNIFFSKKHESFFIDKAIWASLFSFLISQLFDIQYLDGKISIFAWMLISSLKNIVDERNNK